MIPHFRHGDIFLIHPDVYKTRSNGDWKKTAVNFRLESERTFVEIIDVPFIGIREIMDVMIANYVP